MLGYSSNQSSNEIFQHHHALKAKVSTNYQKELDCVYDWVKDRNFMTAMDTNTKESWDWCLRSMINPPVKVINKFSNDTTDRVVLESCVQKLGKVKAPSCRICKKILANNIYEKIKFSMVICKCDKMWCHAACADEYVLKTPQCNLCKDWFILSPYCSNLRSTLPVHSS